MDGLLHIGDNVALYCEEEALDGFLGAQGINSFTVGVRKATDELHTKLVAREAVFVCRQQHNYSVLRKMHTFIERNGVSEVEAQAMPKYAELLEPRKREVATNEARARSGGGSAVQHAD
jgi:hypothetical protein